MRSLPLLLLLLASPALAQDAAPTPAPPPSADPAAPADPTPPPASPAAAADAVPLPPPPAAAADAVPLPPPPAAAAEPLPAPPPPPAAARLPRFGMRLGLGFPDGATADFVFRPYPWLRLQAGPAWNYLAWGLQGGVALTPIRWAISPVLEVRYGHYFSADLNKFVKNNDANTDMKSLLGNFGYDYFNGQLALEFGSPRGFTFSLGVGLTYFMTSIQGTGSMIRNAGTPDQATVTIRDPSLKAVLPSLRLGMLYYF